MSLFSDPTNVFKALGQLEKELPDLIGKEEWEEFREEIERLKEQFSQSNDPGERRVLAAELVAIVASYMSVRERLLKELQLMSKKMKKVTEAKKEVRQVGVGCVMFCYHGGEKMSEESKVRYLNTFFTEPDSEVSISPDKPLIGARPYVLYVDISPERKGLGEDDLPFPSKALEMCWDKNNMLPLTIVAGSKDFDIEEPCRTLNLPRSGPSEGVRFKVQSRLKKGKGFIQVEAFYQGHLLQSKRVEAEIVTTTDVLDSQRPAQTARITFTTTELLNPAELLLMPERVLTVTVELDKRDNSIDFRFLDRTRGNEELAFYDTHLSSEGLGAAISGVRQHLKLAVTGHGAGAPGYEWIVEADAALLNAWLPQLANVGRHLYRALLPDNKGLPLATDRNERLQAALSPGAVIQVNPVFGQVTIPWALLYEREIKLVRGQTRICELFATSGPDCDCPHASDPKIVCPYAFWGYRYAIEQLPCWVSGELPRPPRLIRVIANNSPLFLNLNVWREFSLWESHRDKIKQYEQVELLVAEEIPQLEEIWEQRGAQLDLMYFYSHGGKDEISGYPYLEISDGRIDSNFLEASQLSLLHHPLIFLNGCGTGDYGPESYVSLIDDFRAAGASGVIGTECAIPEMFAEAYAAALLPRLFRGEPLGQAMLAVRLEFLKEKKNPLGLAYSLYAANEIALGTKVLHS